jgi:hypothetical protein
LFVPTLYRDPATITPAMRGQDVVTLAVAPLVFVSVWLATEGSARARVLALGFAGYTTYTYAGAAFGYRYNPMLLIYIAILSLSSALLVLLSRNGSDLLIMPLLGRRSPRRPVAVFLLFVAVILMAIELAEIATSLVTGVVPASVQRAGHVTFFPYVLDLGFVVPLSLIAAVLLWRTRPLGDVLGAVLLVKAATMGAALVAMNVMSRLAGQPADGLTPFYAVIAIGGVSLSWICLRTAESRQTRAPASR